MPLLTYEVMERERLEAYHKRVGISRDTLVMIVNPVCLWCFVVVV